MAFGFPAYHEEEYSPPSTDGIVECFVEAAKRMAWEITTESTDVLVFRSTVNAWSWGEEITVDLSDRESLSIKSTCRWPIQCVDWGKNRENVERLMAKVDRLSGSSGAHMAERELSEQ